MVDRYKCVVSNVQATAHAAAHPDGEYVKASDHDALAARLIDTEKRLEFAADALTVVERRRDELKARLAEVTRERDEAVALMEAGWIEVAEGPVSKVLRERLDAAIATLQSIASNSCCGGCNEAALVARAFLCPTDSATPRENTGD